MVYLSVVPLTALIKLIWIYSTLPLNTSDFNYQQLIIPLGIVTNSYVFNRVFLYVMYFEIVFQS